METQRAERERFDPANVVESRLRSEEYTCVICHMMLQRPMITRTCGHLFCQDCIERVIQPRPGELQAKSKCPTCRMELRRLDLVDVVTDPTQRLFKDYLMSTTLRCALSIDGCDFVGTYEAMLDHVGSCGQAKVECPHKPCRVRPRRAALESHMETCKYRPVLCDHCGETIPHCHLAEHSEQVTLRKCELDQLKSKVQALEQVTERMASQLAQLCRQPPQLQRTLQEELEDFFASAPEEHCGFSALDAKRHHRFASVPEGDVDAAIAGMMDSGLLYATVDREHYRATNAPPHSPGDRLELAHPARSRSRAGRSRRSSRSPRGTMSRSRYSRSSSGSRSPTRR